MTRRNLVWAPAALLFAGCMQQMAKQPSYHWPDQPTDFDGFADKRGDRPIPSGTVARGQLDLDPVRFSGRSGRDGSDYDRYTTEFPYPVTPEMMAHGKERYAIWCAMCHDRVGTGNGMIVQRGYTKPTSYHAKRLREAPEGYIFDVITNGHGAMAAYGPHVKVYDRWAIVAYIRALQYSQLPPVEELPDDIKAELMKSKDRPAAEAEGDHMGGGN